MDEKQLQALFEAMKGHLDLGDYNTFKNSIYSDSNFRKAFYEEASKNLELGDYATFDNSFKKKELGGGVLSFAGGQVGNGKAPLKEDVSAVEDPAKYLLQPYRERKTAAEKEYQKNLPIGGYNLMAIPKADTKQQYDTATKDLTNMEEQVFNKLFPDTRHAISYIQQKYDQSGGKVPEDNETFKIALQKVNQRKGLDDIVATSGSIEEAAAKYYGDNFNDLPDIKKGKYLASFLNRPEVKEKADEGGQFLHDYNVAKGTLISKYPQYALQKIATDISQELEDKKMTNWFYSNPGVDKTDKAVQQLLDEGKISIGEKNLYDKALRPVIEAGGADVVLKTSDLIHGLGRGLYHGMENIDATLRDVVNRVTFGTAQKAGLIETNEERRKRLEQERLSQTELQPKGGRKFLTEASEFAGFSIPMIFGSMAKVPQAINMALMFEGENADKARELFKDDAGKQDLYTLLSTGADMYIMKLLPTKKFAEGAKNLFAKDISGLINELSTGKITQEQASKTFLEKLTNYAKKVGITNFETANALTAFQLAHNTIDAAFGKRDFHLENEVKEALTNYKTNFLSGTFLSMLGAAPKSNEISTNGKILRELADRSEQVLPEIKNDAEKKKNLETAIQINNELKTRDWNEDAKNKFMASAMKEAVLKEKQKTAPTEALKKQSEEELDRAKKTQEAILAGKNPDEVKTDNEIELERLQKDKELKDKEFAAKRKDLDGRTPEDRPKIEKLEEDKKRADEDYQREVEKLIPKVKPEETFPEGQTVPDEKITETIPEQQPQAISSGEQVGDRQSQINDLMDDVRAFNKLPKNAKNRSYELNQLRLRANDLNLEFDDSYGKLYTKEGKSVHKISSDKPSSLSPDFNEQEYSDETKQHAKILLDNPDALNGLPILGNDGRQLSRKQMESALKSVQEGKPSRAAKSMYDFIEDAVRNGNVEVTDRTTGQSVKVPTDEYFSTFKEPVKELTDEEIMQLNWELSEDSFNFNDEYHGQEIIPSETQSTSAGKTKASAEELSSPTKTPTVSGETSPQIVNEKSQIEIQQSPEVKELTVTDVNKEVGEAEKGTAEPPPEKPTEPVVEGGEETLPERRFTKQMLRSDELSEAAKGEISKTLNYVVQTHEMTIKEANEVIEKVGLDEAQNLVMTDTDIHPVVRVTVGMTLIKKYSELAQKAENQETKNYYHDKSIQTATFVTEKLATEPGQMIEAFSMWSRLSPEAQLRAANQDMARQGKEKLRRREKDIKVISDKFQKANEEAADELTKSENVKKAVEKTESKRTLKAKDKIAAARKARENIIKKYKGDRGKNLYAGIGLTKEGIEFVGDLVKTYVQEGVAKLEIVIDKVLQHLKEVSGKEPNDEVKKNVTDIVKEQIEKKENLRITEGLSELEKEVNKIVREHYTVPEEAKKKLIDKFIDKAGLEKEDAEQLAKEIEAEFDKIATRKKRNILYNEKARFDKINNTLKGSKTPEQKTIANDIIKYSNLGAFESKDFSEMMANKFGLGEISPDQAAKLLELAKRIEKAPEGSPKRDATEDLLAYRAKLRGNDLMETAQSVWYANILSGYKTHEKNIVSTFLNSWGELGAEMLKDPKAIPYLMGGYIKGLSRRGFVEALHTLKTGRSPIHIKKIEVPNILERKKFALGGWNPGNWFKYVMRFMVASDVVSFQGLKEARAYQLARRVAGQEGNTWSKKGWDRVNEILLHTKERYNEATEQLKNEGLLKENGKITNEGKRRLYELMEQNRPVKMTEDAYEFAAHGTYNYASKGTLGAITNAVSGALDAVNIGGFKPLRIIVPFTRIITNVVNNSLDFTPIGFVRAARGVRGFRTFEKSQFTKGAFKELTKEERQRLVAKAAIGITFAATLQALHQAGVIQITGNGPTDQKKRKQLMQEGWHPYSIKVGNKYYSYQYTPLVFVVGFLGNMNDAAEYNEKEDETSFMKRIELAASRIGGQVADMTWINSAGTFLGALTESNPAMQEKKLSGLLTNTAKGFIPFSGAITQGSQLAQNIFEWPQKDVNNAWQGMIQDIPIARNSLNDRINALGEPIVRDPDVFISEETKDPVWKFLLDKKGWVSSVNKETVIIFDPELKMDRPVTGDEYYEFAKLRGKMIRDEIQKIIDNGLAIIDENGNTTTKAAKDVKSKELNIALQDIQRTATNDAKAELFEPKEEMRPIIYPNESKINKVKTLNK